MRSDARTVFLSAAMLATVAVSHGQVSYQFQNFASPIEGRVTNILSLMTLDEKIACLQTSTAVPRLHIPDAGNSEGIHGLGQRAAIDGVPIPTTTFPEVIGMASTWDPDLIHRIAGVEAYEARYISQNPKYARNVLIVWGPNADLARDPRWGRNDESYGEDPFFDGTMAVAFVKGLQGDDPKYWRTASLLKHFLANSNETTRSHSSSDFDETLFRDYYSVPFRMAFEEGGARSFMASYNAWNHVPMTVNPVLRKVAIKEWGVDGIISSDATAVEQLVDGHKYFKDPPAAIAAAIKAGVGQVITFVPDFPARVRQAVEAHLVTEAEIDDVLRGKFRTVIRLGLLDPPEMVPDSKIGSNGEAEPWTTEKHKRVALDAARESIVLLKNSNALLPLDRAKTKSVAVIGPRANEVLIDMYGGQYPYSVTPLQGITRKMAQGAGVTYAADNKDGAAVKAARAADLAIVVVGNHPVCGQKMAVSMFNPDTSTTPCADVTEGREGRDRLAINLPDEQLIRDVYAANKKTVVVLVSSFPYAIEWTQQNVPSILHIAHGSQEEGTAIADVLFGDYNPAGRVNQTWPKSLAQLPQMDEYNIRDGRTYMYFKGEPLYPFGYGLSYTTFEYSNATISAVQGVMTVSAEIRNSGRRAGDEVVQLYVRSMQGGAQQPMRELKSFQRITLGAGESRSVHFALPPGSLTHWSADLKKPIVGKGPVEIEIGSSSAEIKLKKTLVITP